MSTFLDYLAYVAISLCNHDLSIVVQCLLIERHIQPNQLTSTGRIFSN